MPALIICIVITVLDQVTKQLIRVNFEPYTDSLVVIPGFFNLVHVRNPGAAWGMLSDHPIILTIVSIVMLILVVVFRKSFLTDRMEHKVTMGLMAGGIIGNVLDRLREGFVTDFLDFHIAGHHWPSFNVADSAICIGVGIYIISSFWIQSHPLNESKAKKVSDPPNEEL